MSQLTTDIATYAEETAASAQQMSATTQQTNASTQEIVASVDQLSVHSRALRLTEQLDLACYNAGQPRRCAAPSERGASRGRP